MLNLKRTDIYEAVQLEKLFLFFRFLKIILVNLATLFMVAFLYKSLSNVLYNDMTLYGYAVLSFSCFLILDNLDSFFEQRLKKPKKILLGKADNIASCLNFKSAKYLSKAIEFSKTKGLLFPNATILLYFFLDAKNPRIIFIFSRLLIDFRGLKSKLKEELSKGLIGLTGSEFEQIFNDALSIAIRREGEEIREGDIIAALSKCEPNLKQIITESEMEEIDFETVNQWQEAINFKIQSDKKFWEYENLLKAGSIGKDWSSGYTPMLDHFSTDWTAIVRSRGFERIIGHKEKISQIEMILSKNGSGNVLLVGDPGSGRKNIIHALIRKALLKKSTPEINDNRFVELDIISLASNITSFEQMESVLDQCFKEVAQAGNVTLIINDFHDFLGKEQKAGIVDISGIITPYLSLPSFKIICLTSYDGLHKYIENRPVIMSQFEKVEVGEMSKEETIQVLESEVFKLEVQYQQFIPYSSLKETVNVAEKYISNYPFPQKAVALLEDAAVSCRKISNSPIMTPDCVDQVISQKVQIPVGKIKSQEKEVLLHLEDILHKRIIAQDEALKEISSALRRARTGVQARKGPMGSFLFLGPTGVGKTETAKALAETYFGSEERMVRIDMSEFQRLDDIPRLLGSNEQEGILTTKIKDDPFTLLLLDEIEKAHPNILNVFLQVLDEGYVNDNLGRKVLFSNTIIIATSNAGYEVILKAIEEGKEMFEIKKELIDFVLDKSIFRPEFLNRFDGIIVFKSLTKENLMSIAQIQLEKINNNLKNKKIKLEITEELKNKIVELSYDPLFGAREMKRVIQDKIENNIAKALLNESIPQGKTIRMNPVNFEISVI